MDDQSHIVNRQSERQISAGEMHMVAGWHAAWRATTRVRADEVYASVANKANFPCLWAENAGWAEKQTQSKAAPNRRIRNPKLEIRDKHQIRMIQMAKTRQTRRQRQKSESYDSILNTDAKTPVAGVSRDFWRARQTKPIYALSGLKTGFERRNKANLWGGDRTGFRHFAVVLCPAETSARPH